MELRCGNGKCGYWLGESAVPLVNLGVVAKAADATVRGPRDLRLCRKCEQVNVFVTRESLGLAA